MRLSDLLEVWHRDIGGVPIYQLRSRRDLLRHLKTSQYKTLRAFLNFSADTVYAWDAGTLVHPDVARNGIRGLPLQLTEDHVVIRHHGMPDSYVWEMYHEVADAAIIKRLYGRVPPIYGEDWEGNETRLDTYDWSDVEPPSDHWEDHFHSY